MAGGSKRESISVQDLQEWLGALGLEVEPEDERPLPDQLRDGVVLCQLVNRIKPNSVEVIKQKRCSGDAEENILRFLQACTTLGVKKIFKPVDLLDDKRDFTAVLVTVQELYHIAAGMGLGVKFTRHASKKRRQMNGSASADSSRGSSLGDEVEGHSEGSHTVRALYGFHGTNEDELQFEKGELITVTKVVDGGWWEGICNGNIGWFPGNYVEEFSSDPQLGTTGENPLTDKRESVQLYHNLVVQDILDSERTYVHDLHVTDDIYMNKSGGPEQARQMVDSCFELVGSHQRRVCTSCSGRTGFMYPKTLLSVYLVPLKSTSIISPRDAELLTGNLADLIRWQQAFFTTLESCSKVPIQQQNFGAIFTKASKEMEALYTAYCANHPKAVAVLTDNSDKLSTFMESRGAPSPGILALTSNLSKPFRRLEKYPGLLKELQRHLTDGHPDAEKVSAAITSYEGICSRTQETRKRKEMEHEMLTNPVQGFSGTCLVELGECKCVVRANVAVGPEEVDEQFFLVFPDSFVILAVGMSLSGYEMKAQFPLASTSIKKGSHTEQWPFAVEVLHNQETIHASMDSIKDQNTLIECIGRQEGVPTRSPRRSNSTSSKVVSRQSSSLFRAYNQRAMRQAGAPIQRQHHWGFKSLRPMAPLNAPQLMGLKEQNKSPKAAKKFIYPAVKRKRSSKALEELQLAGMGRPNPAETRSGDTAILNVVEAYCSSGRFKSLIQSDRPSMPLPYAGGRASMGAPPSMFSADSHTPWAIPSGRGGRSTTLPSSGRYHGGPPLPDDRMNRALSPILLASYNQEPPRAMQYQRESYRKRAESVDSSTNARVKF